VCERHTQPYGKCLADERRSVFQRVPRWRRCNGCSRDSLMEDYSKDHVVMVHAVPADGANGRG